MTEILEPDRYKGVAAAVVEKAVRDLTAKKAQHRRLARAWWTIPDNPLREFWSDAAGMNEDAMIEKLTERGLLDEEPE